MSFWGDGAHLCCVPELQRRIGSLAAAATATAARIASASSAFEHGEPAIYNGTLTGVKVINDVVRASNA
jgi:hypothetical protein